MEQTANTMPAATLGQYKGLACTRRVRPVSDKAVEADIGNLARVHAPFVPTDAPAARGMRITLDFEGFLAGASIPDSRMENVIVVLGTGQLMPAAEEAVYGHCAGETFRFDFTYPADFRVPELSGKTAQFEICLHTVERKQVPPVDDALAKSLGFADLNALRESLREKKRLSHEANADRIAGAALLDMAGANLTVELPAELLAQNAEYQMTQLRQRLRKELTRLVDFFGQPMFEARFSLAYEEKEYPYHVQELTRREMLEQVSHGSKSGTKKLLQMLPGLRSEEDSGVDFRLLLHQRTKQLKAAMETPLQYGYYMPKFTDNCFGCGRCEKACRANALKFEEMPNGQTRMVLTPWKCSECGVCMNVCSNKGFDGMKLYQLTTLGPVVLHKCTKTLCKQCGKPIAPDSAEGLCSVCRIKARTLKRQEEARQRAEQLKAERAAKAAEEAAKAAENAVGTAAEATSETVEAAAQTAETAAALPETIPAGQSAAPANVTAPALGEPVSE